MERSRDMSTSPVPASKVIHGLSFSRAGVLKQQVLAAQIAGIIMIVAPSVLMGEPFTWHAFAAIPVAVFTYVYFAYAYFSWGNRSDSVLVLHRMRSTLWLLVALDVLVILGLIGLSGGLAKSHLTVVLALIPPILGLVRGGGAAVIRICVLILVAVVSDLSLAAVSLPQCGASSILASLLENNFNLQKSDPQLLVTLYPLATSLGILCSVALAVVQYYLGSGETLPEDVFQRITIRHPNGLEEPRDQKRLMNVLARSYHKVSRIISLTNHPDIHCSLVHPIDDLLFEAYVLALPAYRKRGSSGAQLMANMVFAIHWLDDLFDGLGYHTILEGATRTGSLGLLRMNVKDVGRIFRPYGAKRVMDLITCHLNFFERVSFAKPAWPAGIESGLMRVILGGIIQNSKNTDWRDAAVERLRRDVRALVEDSNLNERVNTASPVFLWSISKTDMPLVLGIFASPSDTQNIGSLSLLLDAALMPLLVWHDLNEEINRESVGGSDSIGGTLLEDIHEAVQEATTILQEKSQLLRDSPLWDVMKPTVEHVQAEFSHRLPTGKVYDDFKFQLEALLSDDK